MAMIRYKRAVLTASMALALASCSSETNNTDTRSATSSDAGEFSLNEREYFQNRGVGVMAFHDTFPESHQSGLIMVMHGTRIATNGDLRLEATPGQWSPVPKLVSREVDREKGEIRTKLSYPDEKQQHRGFNPLHYPDLELSYEMSVSAEGDSIKVRVDLDEALPEEWVGQVGFVLELYPEDLFGKTWMMDDQTGLFPRQAYGVKLPEGVEPEPQILPNGELRHYRPLPNHKAVPVPLAVGNKLSIAPNTDEFRMQIESSTGEIELHDGRNQHQNGWFIVRTTVPAGATDGAIELSITPNVTKDWISPPSIQHSMVGYHPKQEKIAIIEADPNDSIGKIQLQRLSADGQHITVLDQAPKLWGDFLRYQYHHFDFSQITEEGMYKLKLGDVESEPFRIAANVYDQNVWQPTLEYFLPVQMGHMRVKEKYKLWHDASHMDDALMAPTDVNHFDGYVQGSSTLTKFKSGEHVPGLAQGGWYDAGDGDFRIESQSGEVFILALAYEEFDVQLDTTLVNQTLKLTEIREPDGKADILQQIEHGLLTVVGGYESLGRLYRGIITPTLTQYVMGGDFSGQTDNRIHDANLGRHEKQGEYSGLPDDRWVFTEENPAREFDAIGNIAATVNAMREYNPDMAERALKAAEELWRVERTVDNNYVRTQQIHAAVELFRATGSDQYRSFILEQKDFIIENFDAAGWHVARAVHDINDAALTEAMAKAAAEYYQEIQASMANTPYGLDFKMQLWGRAWTLQHQAVAHYFLHKAFPEEFGNAYLLNVVHYVLGANPGTNHQSYVSGVGAKSKAAAYGINRMEYSYVPGGVTVGTALVAPDFPEYKEFPFLWQQSEYVLGGGSSNFMFLALAANQLLNQE
jgi:endoglucanase